MLGRVSAVGELLAIGGKPRRRCAVAPIVGGSKKHLDNDGVLFVIYTPLTNGYFCGIILCFLAYLTLEFARGRNQEHTGMREMVGKGGPRVGFPKLYHKSALQTQTHISRWSVRKRGGNNEGKRHRSFDGRCGDGLPDPLPDGDLHAHHVGATVGAGSALRWQHRARLLARRDAGYPHAHPLRVGERAVGVEGQGRRK